MSNARQRYLRVGLAVTTVGLLVSALVQVRAVAIYANGEVAAPLTVTTMATTQPIVDLNGDGNGDVFTYNALTGVWSRQITLAGGGFTEELGNWQAGMSVQPAAFNDDELTDFFVFSTDTGEWFKMLNTGTDFSVQATSVWWPSWERHVMDLDGDGLSDLFLYDPVTGQWFKCLSTLTGFDYIQGAWIPGWQVFPVELNVDSLGDLFLFDRTTGRWFWVVSEADGSFTYPQTSYWEPDWAIYPGDFNGDGRSDLFLYRAQAGEHYVAMNTGGGFSYTHEAGWVEGWAPTVADLNADGFSDLFLYNKTTGEWFELEGNGAGQFTTVGQGAWIPGWDLHPTDFNGDGRLDLLLYQAATGEWFQAWNFAAGGFTYFGGQWQAGLSISASFGVTGPSQAPAACLLTTTDLTIGNTVLALNGCGAAVGGNLAGTNPAAAIAGTPTPQVNVAGTCTGTCSAMGTLTTGTAAPVDPLAGLAPPVNPGGCTAGVAATLNPGCYTSISSTVTTLNPGVYYVTGVVDIENLSGTNVMIYLTGTGQLTSANNEHLTLTAPTSGPYAGIAIFQDASNSNNFELMNNFTLSVSGAIYMPGVDVEFKNAVSVADTGCTLFIARSLSFSNTSGTLSHTGCEAAFPDAGFFRASMRTRPNGRR